MTRSAVHVVCPHCGAVNRVPRSRLGESPKCGSCHQPLLSGTPLEVDAAGFDQHIARNDIPVVVDFWAPWCGPCHAMAPALERATAMLEPRYRVLKLNTEAAPAVAARYGIRSIPTLMLFAGGRKIAEIAGAMDTRGIVSWVTAHEAAADQETAQGTAHRA